MIFLGFILLKGIVQSEQKLDSGDVVQFLVIVTQLVIVQVCLSGFSDVIQVIQMS